MDLKFVIKQITMMKVEFAIERGNRHRKVYLQDLTKGEASSRRWLINDVEIASAKYTSHLFLGLGVHTITLQVTDKNGVVRSARKEINIYHSVKKKMINSDFTYDSIGYREKLSPPLKIEKKSPLISQKKSFVKSKSEGVRKWVTALLIYFCLFFYLYYLTMVF